MSYVWSNEDPPFRRFCYSSFGKPNVNPSHLAGEQAELWEAVREGRRKITEQGELLPDYSAPSYTSGDLIARLLELRAGGYADVRDEYLAINEELSKRRAVVPEFRPLRKRPWKADGSYTAEETRLLQDHLVIDLNWLHQIKPKDSYSGTDLADLFRSSAFDGAKARELAEKNFKIAQKADEWGIGEADQLFLGTLRTDEVRDKLRSLRKRAQTVENKLSTVAARDKRLKATSGWKNAWLAREIARSECGGGGEPGPQRITDIYNMISGERLSRATIAERLKRIDDRLSEFESPKSKSE